MKVPATATIVGLAMWMGLAAMVRAADVLWQSAAATQVVATGAAQGGAGHGSRE